MRLKPIEPWEPSALRLAIEAACVAGLVLALLWPLRLYGFDLVDEGTQLAQLERAAAGDRPYLDFETGYTPGYFALGAWLLERSDGTIVGLRTFGVVWQSVLVAGLWATIRAWSGPFTATAIAALYVAFLLPFSVRVGAPFNIPYPGWLAGALALAVQVMVARVSARRIRRRSLLLAACGALAGLAFSVKPNAGLLILAGATLALIPSWSPEGAINRVLAALVRISAVLATGALLAPGLGEGYGMALFLPVAIAAFRAAPSFPDGDAGLRHMVLLALGFGVVVLPWLLPLVAELGADGVLRTVFLMDGGVVAAYLLPFPAPTVSTLVIGAGTLVAYFARRRADWLPLIVGGTLVLAAVAGAPVGARLAAENALLWVGTIVVVVGLADREALDESSRERAAFLFLSVFSLQLFPRPDSFHVAMGGPPLALGTALVWRGFVRVWRSECDPQSAVTRWAPTIAVTTALLLAVGRAAPAWVPIVTGPLVDAGLGPRAPVSVVGPHRDQYARAARLVSEVRARTRPGEALFTFPDLAGLGYLAGRAQPNYYLYFVPGRPDAVGERRAIAGLEREEPPLVLTCPPQVEAFSEAPSYFERLGDVIARTYAPAVEIDECTVWTRRPTSE